MNEEKKACEGQRHRKWPVLERSLARERIDKLMRSRYIGNATAIERAEVFVGPALLTPTPWLKPGFCNRCMGPGGLLLAGGPSTGKTTLARLVSAVTELPYLEADGSTKNPDHLFKALQQLHERAGIPLHDYGGRDYESAPCIVMLDEAHKLEGKGSWLLKATEPKDGLLLCSHGRMDCRNIFWMLGTTNPERLDEALFTRLSLIWLQSYTAEEASAIVGLDYPDLTPGARLLLAKYGGQIPRVALKLADEARRTASWHGLGMEESVVKVAGLLGIDEEGISGQHVQVLRALDLNEGLLKMERLAEACRVPDDQLEKLILPRLILATPERAALVRMTVCGCRWTVSRMLR